ncbi:MAG: hypothetical protein F4X97_12345 [Boseongicola sp. SB0662_bin_57]|nr:hypothetical protein [Boseongicola sp. SB0662_bin_57]
MDDPYTNSADLCLYCINWASGVPERNFKGVTRDDIHAEFAGLCGVLQYRGTLAKDGMEQRLFGIFFVPDPFIAHPQPK